MQTEKKKYNDKLLKKIRSTIEGAGGIIEIIWKCLHNLFNHDFLEIILAEVPSALSPTISGHQLGRKFLMMYEALPIAMATPCALLATIKSTHCSRYPPASFGF